MEEEKKNDVKDAVVRESQIFNPQNSERKTGGFLMRNNPTQNSSEEVKQEIP